MEPEEEKIETPVEAPAEVPVEEPVEASSESEADAVEAAAPEEERKPTPMPKPKEPKIPLPSSLQEIVGALLFASQTPLTITDLRQCIRGVEPEEGDNAEVMGVFQGCTTREVEQAVHGLEKELERSGCGFRLVCAGGAYRLQTTPSCGRYVRALLKLDRPNRLTRASLETLAIVAYRQPITKSEVEQIRGVAVDTIMLNAIDPTLQRSNPRERAKLFVKKEKPKEEASTLEDAAREAAEAAAAPADSAVAADESSAAPDTAPFDGEEDDDGEATPTTSARIGSTGVNDDDDIFIDDTPDEFDDDDDDDLDEEELDDEEDDMDEEEGDDDEE